MVGINTIMYYGPQIIIGTGIKIDGYDDDLGKKKLGIMFNIPLAFMNALGSGISALYIDKLGRRHIMLRSLPGVFISCLVVAFSMYLSLYFDADSTNHQIGTYLALAGLVSYLAFFSFGMSSTVWSVNTEIYPLHLIGTASALSTATNWLSNFVVSTTFLSIMKSGDFGKVIAFVILSAFGVVCFFFINYNLPET